MERIAFNGVLGTGDRRSLDHRVALLEHARSMIEEVLTLLASVDVGNMCNINGMGIRNEPSSNGKLCSGLQGILCTIDWSIHKTEPEKYPINK